MVENNIDNKTLRILIFKLFDLYTKQGGKIDSDFINDTLFIQNEDGTKSINNDIFSILKKSNIDMNGISFDNVHIRNHSFDGLNNVEINIDRIPNKDISNTQLSGVRVIGSLDGAKVDGTKFDGYIGSLTLNPQTIKDKNLKHTSLSGITIAGEERDLFVDVCIEGTNFSNTLGKIKINPQTIANKSLLFTKLDGVQLVGDYNSETDSYNIACFDDCRLCYTDFNGCIGEIKISLQKVRYKTISFMKGEGITFYGPLDGVTCSNAKLIGCYYVECFEECNELPKVFTLLPNGKRIAS